MFTTKAEESGNSVSVGILGCGFVGAVFSAIVAVDVLTFGYTVQSVAVGAL